jgi:hypothetical protein
MADSGGKWEIKTLIFDFKIGKKVLQNKKLILYFAPLF